MRSIAAVLYIPGQEERNDLLSQLILLLASILETNPLLAQYSSTLHRIVFNVVERYSYAHSLRGLNAHDRFCNRVGNC